MDKIKKFFKSLIYIVNNYEKQHLLTTHNIHALSDQIEDCEKIIKERTEINIDIGFKGANHVIVVGKYKGQDYVQTYDIRNTELEEFIYILKRMEKYGEVARVDSPPSIKASFIRDRR